MFTGANAAESQPATPARSEGLRFWVTPALVLANVAVFCAMVYVSRQFAGFDLYQLSDWGADYAPLTVHQWWRLFSSLFVHLNILHLVFNMWALWVIGRQCEKFYGSFLFLILYFATGVFASLTSILWNPDLVSVGASGTIFGVLAALVVFLFQHRSQMAETVTWGRLVPALLFMIFNLASGAFQPGIDNAAHVGGAISGLVFGRLLSRTRDANGTFLKSPFSRAFGISVLAATSIAVTIFYLGGVGASQTVPDRYLRAHEWYSEGEGKNLQLWGELATQSASGTISDATVADRFDREVRPFWQSAYDRLSAEKPPADQKHFADLLKQFVRLRLAWVKDIVDATRNERRDKLPEIQALATQTEAVQAHLQYLRIRAALDDDHRALRNFPIVAEIQDLLAGATFHCALAPPSSYEIPVADSDSRSDGPAIRKAIGCDAQRMFLSGEYKSLDGAMHLYTRRGDDLPDGGSSLSGVSDGLDDLFEYGGMDLDGAIRRTAAWRRAEPGSIEPDLVEAMIYSEWAWAARGRGFANTVSPQALQLFTYRTEYAAAALDEQTAHASESPLWYTIAIGVGRDQSIDKTKLEAVFGRGVAKYPAYWPLYRRMLNVLMPRWLGSYEEIDAFINQHAKDKTGRADPERYAQLYAIYGSLEGDDANIFVDGKANWPMMKDGLGRMIKNHPRSDYTLNVAARFACVADDMGQYIAWRKAIGKRISATAWTLRTTISGCDGKYALH